MFGDLMGKMQQAKEQAEKIKQRLNSVYVNGKSGNGKVNVIATGNREIKDIIIDESLLSADVEEIQDLLVNAVNNALEQANNVNEMEMKSAASGILPNIPGLDNLL